MSFESLKICLCQVFPEDVPCNIRLLVFSFCLFRKIFIVLFSLISEYSLGGTMILTWRVVFGISNHLCILVYKFHDFLCLTVFIIIWVITLENIYLFFTSKMVCSFSPFFNSGHPVGMIFRNSLRMWTFVYYYRC